MPGTPFRSFPPNSCRDHETRTGERSWTRTWLTLSSKSPFTFPIGSPRAMVRTVRRPNGNESRKKPTDPESLVSTSLVDIDPNMILTPNSGDPNDPQLANTRPARVISTRTGVIKNNGFNPVWEELLSILFDVARFTIKDEGDDEESRRIAVHSSSLGSLRQGIVSGIKSVLAGELTKTCRLSQLSQYLFSILFVQIELKDVIPSQKASLIMDP